MSNTAKGDEPRLPSRGARRACRPCNLGLSPCTQIWHTIEHPLKKLAAVWRRSALAEMMDFAEAVNWSRKSFHPRLDLQRQELRVVTRLVQVAAVKPERLLLGWLPHVA